LRQEKINSSAKMKLDPAVVAPSQH